jgi:hypothetical protein
MHVINILNTFHDVKAMTFAGICYGRYGPCRFTVPVAYEGEKQRGGKESLLQDVIIRFRPHVAIVPLLRRVVAKQVGVWKLCLIGESELASDCRLTTI